MTQLAPRDAAAVRRLEHVDLEVRFMTEYSSNMEESEQAALLRIEFALGRASPATKDSLSKVVVSNTLWNASQIGRAHV